MALSRQVKSSQMTEVTIEAPQERPSTQIEFNEKFTIDLEDLNYKKNRETSETTTDRQKTKDRETYYLEEIDDGPKRSASKSDDKSTSRLSTVQNIIQETDLEYLEKKEKEEVSKEEELPYELRTSNDPLNCEVSVPPETSHSKDLNKRKMKSRLEDPLCWKNTKLKKGDDKKCKKNETKKKAPKDRKNNESRKDLECSILTKQNGPFEQRSSVFRTSDAGNGIEILYPSYLLPEDSNFESTVWTPEERSAFLKENNFSHVHRFRTDIFHIRRQIMNEAQIYKGLSKYLYFPDIDSSNITIRVQIPELSQMNGLCLNFNAYVRFKKQWTILGTIYHHADCTITFNVNQMDSFCIVSTPREDKCIIKPEGYEYVSDADNRITIDFPVGTVSRDEEVDIRVIPLNRESMATKIERNPRNCFILAISECLSVRHFVPSFEKPVEIQLPVDDLPGIESSNVECRYGVFRRKHNRNFYLTDLEVEERNGIPTVAVTSFSEYVILKVRSDMFGKLQDLLPDEIEVAIGDKICCKIVFFVGSRKPNSISVMLECITKDSFEDVTQRRKQMGYELVRQCPSPDFFFPVNQRIRVDVGGRFALTKHIGKGYYFLTFFPIAADNFIIFPVEKYSGMESAVYGIISFKEDNGTKKDLHAIHYDPWSSRGKPTPRQTHMTSRSAPVSRQMTAASDVRKGQPLQANFDEIFFSDKGLLAIAQSLSPDSMFKVVINLDMTKAQYEQITNDYAQLTTSSRHLQLLKTAIDISNEDTKIQRLSSALRDSDENSLADKVEELYRENMKITRFNLERKNTVVTIKK